MPLVNVIPSMFHRRLALLCALVVAGMSVILARAFWLTIVQGEELRARAESRLVQDRWTPTVRGRILDRKGRVLAEDRPTFDVALDYRVLTGQWAYEQAARRAFRENKNQWKRLSPQKREALIQALLPEFTPRLEDMWRTFGEVAGIELDELDRRRHEIVERVQRMASTVWAKRVAAEKAALREQATSEEFVLPARPIAEQEEAHVLLRGLDDATAFRFRAMTETVPGLKVVDASRRRYLYESVEVSLDRSRLPSPLREGSPLTIRVEGVATQLLGWMREKPQKEDYDRRRAWHEEMRRLDPSIDAIDRGRYASTDAVGSSGLEATQENTLRGLRGRTLTRLDTGEAVALDATPGKDVQLTLDAALQARVQGVLDPQFGLTRIQSWHGQPKPDEPSLPIGHALASAAVVIDVGSGDILAMASSPSFTREQLQRDPASIFQNPGPDPWLDRPLARPYEPGSIVKPLVLVEAVSKGVHSLEQPIECNGHFLPNNPNILRCWIYRKDPYNFATHMTQTGGPLYAREALARSCNIYFYTIGRALGLDGMQELYRKLGVGTAYSIGASGAVPGFLGRVDGKPWSAIDASIMAIGQGPVGWTPLHAADAYATLARRGLRLTPRLIMGAEQSATDLKWNARAVEEALGGLADGVRETYGTAHHIIVNGAREDTFNVPGARVLAKTGTAQANPFKGDDPDGDGPLEAPTFKLDHAWCVALVGDEGGPPRYAIAVVTEYGGSGGKVSGPVANQIVQALVEEGYLHGAGTRAEAAP